MNFALSYPLGTRGLANVGVWYKRNMRWKRGHVSKDVEDRRGRSVGKKGAAIGGGGLLVAVIAVLINGGGVKELLGLASSSGSSQSSETSSARPRTAHEQELFEFISYQLDDQQETWEAIFQKRGKRYQRASLVIFEDGVQSACGNQGKEVGPFYCPADQKAYVDVSFFKQLSGLGGPGDFAQAYVLAHEIGHHIQQITGASDRVRRLKAGNRAGANALSVRSELQADCYAGVWANSADKRNKLEMGDLEEGLKAAAAIGDDTLQSRGGGRVRPESWTHGSSAQRVKWFKIGYQTGSMDSCDTFVQ